jgi:hypothetical protein
VEDKRTGGGQAADKRTGGGNEVGTQSDKQNESIPINDRQTGETLFPACTLYAVCFSRLFSSYQPRILGLVW